MVFSMGDDSIVRVLVVVGFVNGEVVKLVKFEAQRLIDDLKLRCVTLRSPHGVLDVCG